MKKLIIIITIGGLLTATAFISPTAGAPSRTELNDSDSVLICNSEHSYAYHKYYCRGLKRCKSSVIRVTLVTAKKKGKTKPCGYCYK